MIAVFAAMAVEVNACLSAAAGGREKKISGFSVIDSGDVLICQTGLGRRAREAAESVFRHTSPAAVLSVGTAGGLVSNLDAGHIVFCERVGHESEQRSLGADAKLMEAALAAAEAQGLPARTGVSVTVDTVAWTPEDKARLRASGEPDIVEMESYWVARAAAERRLPFLAIRAVSDGPDNTLIDIPDLFDEHGQVKPESVVAYTRDHPEAIPQIAAQHHRGGRALDSLGLFVSAFVPQLALA